MAYRLQIGESYIHITFVVWVVFTEGIFLCSDLKPDNEFLPFYVITSLKNFYETEYDLTDIIIA